MTFDMKKIMKESFLICICLVFAVLIALSVDEHIRTSFREDLISVFIFTYLVRWVIGGMVKAVKVAWGKSSREQIECLGKITKDTLRKDRKNLVTSMILYSFLIGLSKIIMNTFRSETGVNLMMVIAGLIFCGGIISLIAGLGILRKLCFVLYKDNNPQKYFIIFTVLIIAGITVMALPMVIVLFIVWFKTKNILRKKNKSVPFIKMEK